MERDSNRYYLVDLDRSSSTGVVYYWKPYRHGYTPILSEAGLYGEKESYDLECSDFDKSTLRIPKDLLHRVIRNYDRANSRNIF